MKKIFKLNKQERLNVIVALFVFMLLSMAIFNFAKPTNDPEKEITSQQDNNNGSNANDNSMPENYSSVVKLDLQDNMVVYCYPLGGTDSYIRVNDKDNKLLLNIENPLINSCATNVKDLIIYSFNNENGSLYLYNDDSTKEYRIGMCDSSLVKPLKKYINQFDLDAPIKATYAVVYQGDGKFSNPIEQKIEKTFKDYINDKGLDNLCFEDKNV